MNYVIAGPPGSGKTTHALEQMKRGDALVDVDYLFHALSGLPLYDKPVELLPLVLGVRDDVIGRIEQGMTGDAYIVTSAGRLDVILALCARLEAEPVIMAVAAEVCKERIANDPRRDSETDWNALVDTWWNDYAGDEARSGERMDEKRIIKTTLQLRADGDGPASFEGYAAVFNQPSVDMGFVETVDPGAFARTLAAEPDVLANIQHEGGLATIGRTRNGTLQLATDDVGLRVRIMPPDTQAGRDAMTLVRGGYVDQMSFAFSVRSDQWSKDAAGKPLRRLLDVELDGGDVAIVTGAAYPQTTVEVRDRAAALAGAGDAADANGQIADGGAGARVRLANRKRQLKVKQEQGK